MRDRRIIFRTDQVLALRLKNYQVMSILLDELQTGRDAQPGEAGLIMHYALWLASCARESSAARKNGLSSDLSSESAIHRVKNLHVRRDMRTREGVCARKENA